MINRKGLSLPLNLLVVVVVLVLVLVTVLYFIFLRSSYTMSQAEANKIFYEKCNILKESGYHYADAKDNKFVKACQVLFGFQNNAWSCLRLWCEQRKEPSFAECNWRRLRCENLKSNNAQQIYIDNCCNELKSACPDVKTLVCR